MILLWRNTNLLFEADIVVNEKLSNNMNMKAKKFLLGESLSLLSSSPERS